MAIFLKSYFRVTILYMYSCVYFEDNFAIVLEILTSFFLFVCCFVVGWWGCTFQDDLTSATIDGTSSKYLALLAKVQVNYWYQLRDTC